MEALALTDSQWDQYEALLAQMQLLSVEERAAALQRLGTAGEVAPPVLALLTWRVQRRPDPDRCRTGERIGNCTLGEELGAGGMGVVYQAQQHLGDARREVAVKLLHPRWLQMVRQEAFARFRAELHTLARLEHTGIARIYDGGSSPDPHTQEPCPYIVMQLVPHGQPITTYAQQCHLTVPDRLALFVQVCDAVRYAHEHRIVHRDLKPANILVNADEHPVVIDFGLARAYDALVPGAEMVSGTPAYMSPEQLSPAWGRVSEHSDVYALGVILYELITGHRPYEVPPQGSLEQWRQLMREAQAPPLRQYSKTYPRELEAILTAALAKRPEDRLTVDTLRARIAHALHAWRRLQPGRIACVVGLGAVLTLGGIVWLRHGDPPRAPVVQTLSGVIWDDNHHLLAGVTVVLAEFNHETTTDQHGQFTFAVKAPPQRSVRLLAQKAGYQPYDAYATLGNPAFTFLMRKAP